MTTPETQLKSDVKELLAVYSIFNYPLVQGLGAHKGIPDRVAHIKGVVHYLEFKRPKGTLSAHQEVFKAHCDADGIPYHVIRSLDQAMELVKELLK